MLTDRFLCEGVVFCAGVDVSLGAFAADASAFGTGDFVCTGDDDDDVAEIDRFNAVVVVVVTCLCVVGFTYTILSASNRSFVCILAGCETANSSRSASMFLANDFNCCCFALKAAACGVPGFNTS